MEEMIRPFLFACAGAFISQCAWFSIAAAVETGPIFRDCDDCPEMVVLPPGSFTMGFPAESDEPADEKPSIPVTIDYQFAVSRFEITRGQFAEFQRDTLWGVRQNKPCEVLRPDKTWSGQSNDHDWQKPGFEQNDDHPVVCVSLNDAKAYAAWLSVRTGRAYRLPSEAEFEYASRAGTVTDHYWGDIEERICEFANITDETTASRFDNLSDPIVCNDGYAFTSPVGSYLPNDWGLFDTAGNAAEWVEDCWKGSHLGKPRDGKPYLFDDCPMRRVKGGSWFSSFQSTRVQGNSGFLEDDRWSFLGFRLVRVVETD